jgi:hypothetical protein
VGSNPTQGIDIFVYAYSAFVLSCVYVAALRRDDYSFKESYRLGKKKMITKFKKSQGQTKGSRAVVLNLCETAAR